MGVYVTHLVFVALGHADDEVVDETAHGTEGGDVFARAVVELNVDHVGRRFRERDGQMAEILDQLAAGAFDGDHAGLDVHFDCGRICLLVVCLVRSCP